MSKAIQFWVHLSVAVGSTWTTTSRFLCAGSLQTEPSAKGLLVVSPVLVWVSSVLLADLDPCRWPALLPDPLGVAACCHSCMADKAASNGMNSRASLKRSWSDSDANRLIQARPATPWNGLLALRSLSLGMRTPSILDTACHVGVGVDLQHVWQPPEACTFRRELGGKGQPAIPLCLQHHL